MKSFLQGGFHLWLFQLQNMDESAAWEALGRVPISSFCFYILQPDIYFQQKKS